MRGYSLIEVLIAITIVTTGVAGLAQLMALSADANAQARRTTIAAILAQQKLEELLPADAGELVPSPADALARNAGGYADFFDRAGHPLGGGPTPPAGSANSRRWSIDAATGSPGGAWILQVLVTDRRSRGVARIVAARSHQAF